MSELAFNYKGQRFAPPSEAAHWRVRRFRDGQRGALDIVLDADGLPLIVPIDVSIDGFRDAVRDQHGRYRLDALDAHQMPMADAEAAYVTVPQPRKIAEMSANGAQADGGFDDLAGDVFVSPVMSTYPGGLRNAAPMAATVPSFGAMAPSNGTVTAPFGTWPALPVPVAMSGVEYLLAEAMRGQVQTQIEQMRHLTTMMSATLAAQTSALNANAAGAAQMMSAAAELLRAADGAAMPRRDPPPPAPPAPPAPPTPPAPPAPPAPPTVVYAMPRNAAFVDDGCRDDDDDDDDCDGDSNEAPAEAVAEDFFTKANKLVATVGQAIAPVAEVAKLVMGAGIGGLGAMFGGNGGEAPRNAAESMPDAEPVAEPQAAPALGHLRVSHVLAVSHELGAKDGSLFRRMIRVMEPDDRRMFIDRLCELPLEDAVAFAAEQVAWLEARIARSPRATPDLAQEDTTAGTDDAEPDNDADLDERNHDEEHDTTHHDTTHIDDHNLDQEHDTTQQDDTHADDDLDEQEHDNDLDDTASARSHEPAVARVSAGATVEPSRVVTSTEPSTKPTPSTPTAPEVPRPLTPDVAAHMKLIAKHLTFGEIMRGQALVNQTSVRERNAWIERLMSLAPVDAAAVLRAELARRAGRTG